MKHLLVLLLLVNQAFGQPKLTLGVERYTDPFERSYYPIGYFELGYSVKQHTVSFSAWSGLDRQTFWPYYNINWYYKNFVVTYNPFKPDLYNYKIQVTLTKTL